MNTQTFLHRAPVLVAAGLLAACSQGPSERELTQACLKGSHPQMVNEAMCACFARATLKNMPPKLQQAMMLEMRGDKQKAAEIVADLSFDERAEVAMKQLSTLGECIDAK